MSFQLSTFKVKHLDSTGEKCLCNFLCCKIVNHALIRPLLTNITIFKINNLIAIWIAFSYNTWWERNLFFAWSKYFDSFAFNLVTWHYSILIFSINAMEFGWKHHFESIFIFNSHIIEIDFLFWLKLKVVFSWLFCLLGWTCLTNISWVKLGWGSISSFLWTRFVCFLWWFYWYVCKIYSHRFVS